MTSDDSPFQTRGAAETAKAPSPMAVADGDVTSVERAARASKRNAVESATVVNNSRSTQPCIPPGSLNRVPASAGVRAGMPPLPGGR